MIKVFTLEQANEVNEFLKTVYVEQGGLQIMPEGFIVTYKNKESYKQDFAQDMIDGITKKIAEEEILVGSRKIDLNYAKQKQAEALSSGEVKEKKSELQKLKIKIVALGKQENPTESIPELQMQVRNLEKEINDLTLEQTVKEKTESLKKAEEGIEVLIKKLEHYEQSKGNN